MAVTPTEAQLILPGSGDDAVVTWSDGHISSGEGRPEEFMKHQRLGLRRRSVRNTKQAPAVGMSPTNCLEPVI